MFFIYRILLDNSLAMIHCINICMVCLNMCRVETGYFGIRLLKIDKEEGQRGDTVYRCSERSSLGGRRGSS